MRTLTVLTLPSLALCVPLLSACGGSENSSGVDPKRMADALHAVMESDRTIYTKTIVQRLKKAGVVKPSEHWEEEQGLPLPAQMFRMGAEMVSKREDAGFTYALLSEWPINKQNAPRTEIEKKGLTFIAKNKGKNYYGEEELGGKKFFTAVYADKGVAEACINCHNEHRDSPRNDFSLGDVMGGVVVRIPLG